MNIEPKQCLLCGRPAPLQASHIIPKFVFDWLKETSATGFLRRAVAPNVRVQDGEKRKLLCRDCEAKFARWEKRFAEHLFVPYQKDRKAALRYEKWLLLFSVSVAWRIGVSKVSVDEKVRPELLKALEDAIQCWTLFLLGTHTEAGPYEHHLFLLDVVTASGAVDLPQGFNRYLLRTVDCTVVSSSKKLFVYAKFPNMIFRSSVVPPQAPGWVNTRIEEKGEIRGPQQVSEPSFAEFLVDRAKLVTGSVGEMSARQRKVIGSAALRNPARALQSLTRRAAVADERLRRRRV